MSNLPKRTKVIEIYLGDTGAVRSTVKLIEDEFYWCMQFHNTWEIMRCGISFDFYRTGSGNPIRPNELVTIGRRVVRN